MNRPTRMRSIWAVLFGLSLCVIGCRSAVAEDSPPFFPIGLYCVNSPSPYYSNDVTKEFADIAAAGFNLIQSYQFEGNIDGSANTIEDAKEYLDAAYKSGLKVLMGIPQECVLKRNLACIRKRVAALKYHPALFGWQLYDEPATADPPLSPQNLKIAYDTIKSVDPVHPVSIAEAISISDENYLYKDFNAFDVVMLDWVSMIPLEGYLPRRASLAKSADLLISHGKSLINHLFAYNLAKDQLSCSPESASDYPECAINRYPTKEEMRFLAYDSIILGSKGVSFLCYRFSYDEDDQGDDISRKKNPSQWKAVSGVAAELKSMAPILLAPTQELNKAGVSIAGGAMVEMMIKQYQGKTYLLTVNPSSDPVYIRLALNRFHNPKITLLPEGRRVPYQGGLFEVKFGPYDVHIYEIAGK